jgi:hypothetical protein
MSYLFFRFLFITIFAFPEILTGIGSFASCLVPDRLGVTARGSAGKRSDAKVLWEGGGGEYFFFFIKEKKPQAVL